MTPDSTHDALAAEMAWIGALVQQAMRRLLENDPSPPPDPPAGPGPGGTEDQIARIAVALALAPHLAPEALDPLSVRNPVLDRPFTQVGLTTTGAVTAGTVAFLLGGGTAQRLAVADAVATAPLRDVIVAPVPTLTGPLDLTPGALARLTGGVFRSTPTIPATRLHTRMTWDDLVLQDSTKEQIEDLLAWLDHGPAILADPHLGRALPTGYACLFHGPPGCGKSLTAALLGQRTGRDVWRVDLSRTVSKWIGETEKNLAALFDMAEADEAILFFDEADALFSKRTEVGGANDRFANQEVAYILMRIEACRGLVILASNLRANIDAAFNRRFHAVVPFPAPGPAERLRIWQGLLGQGGRLAPDVDLAALAQDCDLAGGGIVNAARHAALSAARAGRAQITAADLRAGIAREHRKAGRLERAGG